MSALHRRRRVRPKHGSTQPRTRRPCYREGHVRWLGGDEQMSGFDFGPGDPEAFRDAPLFRELQRVMSASSGPVNWELARQVGVANAVEAGPDAEPTEGDRRMLEE